MMDFFLEEGEPNIIPKLTIELGDKEYDSILEINVMEHFKQVVKNFFFRRVC